MRAIPFLATFLLTAATIVRAADVQPTSQQAASSLHLTLDESVTEALANAPALASASAQTEAARAKADSISRARWGQADVVASYSRYQDRQLLRPMTVGLFGPLGFAGLPWDQDQLHYGLTFQVPLYLGGRLSAAVDLARLQTEQAADLLEGSRWEIRANVTSLYAAAQALDAVVHAFDENLAVLDATKQKLALMVDQGRRADIDLLKIKEELEDARARRASAVADRARVRGLLLALIGRSPSLELTVDPLASHEPQLTMSEPELEGLARTSSPVHRGEVLAAQARAGVSAARAASRPTVAVRGNVTQNYGLSLRDQLGTWDLSAYVTVPLWNGGGRTADLAGARDSERAAEFAATKARLDREAQLVEALARFEATHVAVAAARSRIESAAEAARIEQIRYDRGASTVEDLLRARARELAAASALAQAHGDQHAAAARINAVVEKEVVQ
jgi:outer membrane protein TolC